MVKRINDIMTTSGIDEGTVILNGDPNRPDGEGVLMRIGKEFSKDIWVRVRFDDLSDKNVDILIPDTFEMCSFFMPKNIDWLNYFICLKPSKNKNGWLCMNGT